MIALRPFQKRFLQSALAPGIDTAAWSGPRGNGKSWLAGHIAARALDPDDDLFVAGSESVLCAASIEQSRIVFRFARSILEPIGGYRFLDSATRAGITHLPTNTRLRVIGSNGRTAMGLVNCPLAICDEPGAWEVAGGQLLADAIQTAQGKPGSPLKALFVGTLAPARGGWWHELVEGGSHASTHVTALQGDPERWDRWPEIRRCNPLTAISAPFRKKLLEERDAARRDSRLKARFLSYRLNVPTADESTVLLTVDDWKRVVARPVPARQGRPVVAFDLGGGRAWSAAVAIWSTGRMEALAVAPGLPGIEAQEKRDRVPRGTYRALVDTGALRIAEGLRVQPPAQLWQAARAAWGAPSCIMLDRFRLPELQDVIGGSVPVIPRIARWSEASEDIRALRKIAADGPLACEENSVLLVAASLSAAMVKNDDQGSVRLVKRGTNNTARDDVAAALILAAGEFQRRGSRSPIRPKLRIRSLAAA